MSKKTDRNKTLLSAFAFAAALAFGVSSAWAAPNLVNGPIGTKSTWQVKFYLEPHHSAAAAHCLEFTRTGAVSGEPKSGTWESLDLPGWGGDWIQEGDNVQWYGLYADNTTTSSFGALATAGLGTGVFSEYYLPSGPTANDGSWRLLRKNCAPTDPLSPAPATATRR